MKIRFLLSGSSSVQEKGFCAAVWGDSYAFLIDAGFTSEKAFKKTIEAQEKKIGRRFTYVFFTHKHADHWPKFSEKWWKTEKRQYFFGLRFCSWIANLAIYPIRMRHADNSACYGYSVTEADKRAVFLIEGRPVEDISPAPDFLYAESNHDPDILLRFEGHPNHKYHCINSRAHLDNVSAARLIREVHPKEVVVGNISETFNLRSIVGLTLEQETGRYVYLQGEPHNGRPYKKGDIFVLSARRPWLKTWEI